MSNLRAEITKLEERIERALWEHEVPGEVGEALAAYTAARAELENLDVSADPGGNREQRRVLAYCLMRMGNALRQLDRHAEAACLADLELFAARASGDSVTLGRSLMSHGVNALQSGVLEQGLAELDEARRVFESGGSPDHIQGLGWYWILQADLLNAGIIAGDPQEVIAAADQALELLLPIENWPGAARAYAARARANASLDQAESAAEDRSQQEQYERLSQSNPPRASRVPDGS